MWSFASRNGAVYAGTGPNGVVLQSQDLVTWDTFQTVDDCHVRSLYVWANALFMGTEPSGKVFVYNFSTNNFYCFVDTPDHAVTSFMEYGDKLYVGTSPTGFVYSFDGVRWVEEYRTYGRGVNGMAVWNNELFVFCSGTESPLVYDGTTWSLLTEREPVESSGSEDNQTLTVSSLSALTTKPFSYSTFNSITRSSIRDVSFAIASGTLDPEDKIAVTPPNPEFNFQTGVADGNRIVFGGSSRGRVYFYDGQVMGVLFDTDADGVSQIVNLKSGTNIVAMKDRMYLLAETSSGGNGNNA